MRVSEVIRMRSWEQVADTFSLDEWTARTIFDMCRRSDLTATEKQLRLRAMLETERRVGEVFTIGGDMYVTRRGGCQDCSLRGRCAEVFDQRGHCDGTQRHDGRSVCFQKI